MRKLRLASVLLATATLEFVSAVPANVCAKAPATGKFESSTADIGAWNLYGIREIDSQRAESIAQTIFWMDPEVLGLVEVNPPSAMKSIVENLEHLGVKYRYVLKDQPGSLDIAILYKDGVEVTNPKLLNSTNLGNPETYRSALTANIRVGNYDFIMVVVHLKSSRSAENRKARTRQARAIASFVTEATSGTEKDILVIGDYNMIPPSPPQINDLENFESMSPNHELSFISWLELGHLGTHIRKDGRIGNHLDGFAINHDGSDEYVDGSLERWHVGLAWRRSRKWVVANIADHLPIMGQFVITRDDD